MLQSESNVIWLQWLCKNSPAVHSFFHPSNLKGALRCFVKEIQTQDFNIYNINDVMIQTFFHNCLKKLFSEEDDKAPEHCLKLERWQGPPYINKVKEGETVLSFMVNLFI